MAAIIAFLTDNPTTTLLFLVALLTLGFLQIAPKFGAETAAARRLKVFTKNAAIRTRRTRRMNALEQQRHLIAEGAKQLETTNKSRTSDVSVLLEQAGLPWTVRQLHTASFIIGAVIALAFLVLTKNIFIAALIATPIGYFAPRLYVKRIRRKRFAAFIDELPNALDIVVRGTRAGLHVNECFRTIAREAKEPVRGEFAIVCDAQSVGRPISEALGNLANRVPCTETNFLAIAVTLQTSTGGGLSEAIRNLSNTLRERKVMRGDIAAMAMEAKASAAIICPLPLFFIAIIYFISPDFIIPLFTTNTGLMIAGAAFTWMTLGTLLMLKMAKIEV